MGLLCLVPAREFPAPSPPHRRPSFAAASQPEDAPSLPPDPTRKGEAALQTPDPQRGGSTREVQAPRKEGVQGSAASRTSAERNGTLRTLGRKPGADLGRGVQEGGAEALPGDDICPAPKPRQESSPCEQIWGTWVEAGSANGHNKRHFPPLAVPLRHCLRTGIGPKSPKNETPQSGSSGPDPQPAPQTQHSFNTASQTKMGRY